MDAATMDRGVPSDPQDQVGLRVSETHWGYVIHEDWDQNGRESLTEAVLRFIGLVLVMSAYAQWLLPAALFFGDPVSTKAGLSFFLGSVGAAIYWTANRGTNIDLHVDLARRELRIAHRNARGQSRLQTIVPMTDVASAFIARPKSGGASELYLRLRDRDDVMHVATGDENALRSLHLRLSHDLRPLEDRINRRLAMAVPFKSYRTG